ncbi:hypothetical protein GH733_005623 [Mirounga leonina]|nr:hypothetical protein GH733_005623 [Mirounga leonina]
MWSFEASASSLAQAPAAHTVCTCPIAALLLPSSPGEWWIMQQVSLYPPLSPTPAHADIWNLTMPNYKLIYFNMRGRAEIIRYIFAYLDIKYEDHRIEQADWPEVKSTLPFGKIPILEVDGLNLHQSLAIARYLAKNTELEQCQVDAIVDTLDDFMSRFPWAEKKQDIKNQMFNELLTCDGPHLLQDLDTYLGEKEWLTGNSVTWADFYWEICSTTLLVFKPDLLDIHPRLVTLRKKVQAIPAIADWIQRRPQTKL